MGKKYPCNITGLRTMCKHGGSKRFNYGFVSGAAAYCRLAKKWVSNLKGCPAQEAQNPTPEPGADE